MLNTTQKLAAAELLKERPQVLPGTRVILNNEQRKAFYDRVTAVMKSTKVSNADVNDFCDRAGVPD